MDKTSLTKPEEIGTDIAVEPILEVLPAKANDAGTQAIRLEIRDSIAKSDPSMVHMWDRFIEMEDPNEMLRLNLVEMQMVFRVAQNEYWANKRRNDDLLTLLLEQGDDKYDEYMREKKEMHKEMKADRTHIFNLMKTLKQLTQEYNRCLMQRKFFVPIALIGVWKMAMENAVYSNVSNEHQRQAIANSMREAGRALCPSTPSVNEE